MTDVIKKYNVQKLFIAFCISLNICYVDVGFEATFATAGVVVRYSCSTICSLVCHHLPVTTAYDVGRYVTGFLRKKRRVQWFRKAYRRKRTEAELYKATALPVGSGVSATEESSKADQLRSLLEMEDVISLVIIVSDVEWSGSVLHVTLAGASSLESRIGNTSGI